jgi:hypothetical protein
MTNSKSKLLREIEVVKKALSIEPNPNYRFSTWGEFHESYLGALYPEELKQYRRLVAKFAIIHHLYGNGDILTIHNDQVNYRKKVEHFTQKLMNIQHLKDMDKVTHELNELSYNMRDR